MLTGLCGLAHESLGGEAPPLLAGAVQRWAAGQGELAFTQQTWVYGADGSAKEERTERYDPSLPDDRRWRLIDIGGVPATDAQRRKWESHKNGKPKRKAGRTPFDFLDLNHATLVGETDSSARYRVPILSPAGTLLALDEIDVVITVDKRSGVVEGLGVALKEPIRILLGLAQITILDVDFRLSHVDAGTGEGLYGVLPESTARMRISELGTPVEYRWSQFSRVGPAAPKGG